MTATHANLDEARAITSKYLKLPVEIVASVEMPPFNTEVKAGCTCALDRHHEITGHAHQPGQRGQAGAN